MSDSLQPHGLQLTKLLRPRDSPGKNTGVGCHFLLQGIFLTQGSNLGHPHCRRMLYTLSHQGSPTIKIWKTAADWEIRLCVLTSSSTLTLFFFFLLLLFVSFFSGGEATSWFKFLKLTYQMLGHHWLHMSQWNHMKLNLEEACLNLLEICWVSILLSRFCVCLLWQVHS